MMLKECQTKQAFHEAYKSLKLLLFFSAANTKTMKQKVNGEKPLALFIFGTESRNKIIIIFFSSPLTAKVLLGCGPLYPLPPPFSLWPLNEGGP